jgi:hypothetical protein
VTLKTKSGKSLPFNRLTKHLTKSPIMLSNLNFETFSINLNELK